MDLTPKPGAEPAIFSSRGLSGVMQRLLPWIAAALFAACASTANCQVWPVDPTEPRTNAALTNYSKAFVLNSMEALDAKHVLAIGDRLSFRIVEDEEDPKSLMVTDSGELEVPYLGRFPAEGRSCKELAVSLKTELEKKYYYHATVIIAVDSMARTRGKIYVSGAVRAAGPQEVPSDETLTLSKAILRAGGFTDYADKRSVTITRKKRSAFSDIPWVPGATGSGSNEQKFTVDVATILEKGKTELDVPLEPDDLIIVPERLVRF